ncbi:MAG TPA: glycosyltransferase, partial [Porticoccaceae bacterium]|nr:glycosyltransferase [Porticoccaceae bacterium]
MGSLSVVIPVFNAAESLENLCDQLIRALASISDNYEILLIDDGSRDKSWSIIIDLQKHNHRIRGIKLSRNYGQHNALLCGIRAARFETIVTMDDDLQNPISEVPKLLNKLNEGYD